MPNINEMVLKNDLETIRQELAALTFQGVLFLKNHKKGRGILKSILKDRHAVKPDIKRGGLTER